MRVLRVRSGSADDGRGYLGGPIVEMFASSLPCSQAIVKQQAEQPNQNGTGEEERLRAVRYEYEN